MVSSKSLQQAIANIKIWHKGEQRAPHKPLLLLYVLAGYPLHTKTQQQWAISFYHVTFVVADFTRS